jgi:hypothetical protein
MGLDASLKPKTGRTLGSAAEVKAAFERFFPGVVFTRHETPPRDEEKLHSFAAKLMPSWAKVELVGPTAPFFILGDYQADNWSMQAEFDDAAEVPEVFLSMYGELSRSTEPFKSLLAAYPWNLES